MNYQIQTGTETPAYLQLYHLLRTDIVSGVYPVGTKMPSKRVLSSETGLSIVTVEHALALLNDEGYIESKQRSGFYVIYKNSDFNVGSAESKPSVFSKKEHVSSSKGDFPFTVLAKTMRKVISEYEEELLVKSPNLGCAELRSEISAYLARSRGITVLPEQIVIGSGAEYLYGLIAQLLCAGKTVAIEDPSYVKIIQVYTAYGVYCDMLRLGAGGIETTELQRTEATVLHVTPFNSYPSGISAGVSKKHEYLSWARDRKGYIIEDNYDSELTVSRKQEDTLFSMSEDENVVFLNTFSKTIAPSVRVGYMVLPEKLLDEFIERLGFYSCSVPVFEQLVLAELIKNGDYERHINRVRRKKRKSLER